MSYLYADFCKKILFGNLVIKHGVFNIILQEEFKGYTFPLAISIVLSGQYEDDQDNSEDIVYTGQGGNDFTGDKHQFKDQEMKNGNLALKVRTFLYITCHHFLLF